MSYYYSPTTGGFYNDDFSPTIPPDAKPLTDTQYIEVFDAINSGKVVTFNEDGSYTISDPVLTPAQLWAAYQNQAINDYAVSGQPVLNHLALGLLLSDDWLNYRAALLEIISTEGIGDYEAPYPSPPAMVNTGLSLYDLFPYSLTVIPEEGGTVTLPDSTQNGTLICDHLTAISVQTFEMPHSPRVGQQVRIGSLNDIGSVSFTFGDVLNGPSMFSANDGVTLECIVAAVPETSTAAKWMSF